MDVTAAGGPADGAARRQARAHRSERRPSKTLTALTAFAAAVLLAGCGIRTTQVPVDAGAAPSRVPCEVSAENITPQTHEQGVPVRVYMVCASQLESVDRTARITESKAGDSPPEFAQVLLDELLKEPSSPEQEAGFATYVRGPLMVSGAREGDPVGTLRLNRQPEDLPAPALAQIVCTLAESRATAAGGAVVLGGPGDYRPHAYVCSAQTKQRPEGAVPTTGTLPSPGPTVS